jgi:hypothetical protein
MNRLFDLKYVIGIFFLIVGLLLLAYALVGTGHSPDGQRVNLYCGLIMAGFGGVMMLLPAQKRE